MRRALIPLFLLFLTGIAESQTLKPFKDELFRYPGILAEADGGNLVTVDYREQRDINGRDEVPERRVRGEYISLAVRSVQKDLTRDTSAGKIPHFAVGKTKGAAFITIYLHGQGGSRRQGVDDFTFGGNFNRIKNLMWANGGLYLSPDFAGFDDNGVTQVAALLRTYLEASPDARVFIACGSMGGALCWGLAGDAALVPRVGGILMLGSFPSNKFATTPAARRRVPLYLGHGSRDSVFAIETVEAFYQGLRKSGYPVRMARFETGTHGTPIRMTDWRLVLNWMLSQKR